MSPYPREYERGFSCRKIYSIQNEVFGNAPSAFVRRRDPDRILMVLISADCSVQRQMAEAGCRQVMRILQITQPLNHLFPSFQYPPKKELCEGLPCDKAKTSFLSGFRKEYPDNLL